MNLRTSITTVLERIVEQPPRHRRALNASIPDINPEDIIKSPALGKNQSFVEAYKGLDFNNFMGGRQTQPSNFNFFANLNQGNMAYFFIPKKEPQLITVEDIDAGAWSPGGLVNVLIDISPDVSKALWNKLRLSGTSVAFKAVTDDGEDDPIAQKWVDDALRRVNINFGGLDNFIAQAMLSVYVYGALATDSEVGLDLAETGDLYTVLPDSIWFQRDENQIPIPFQLQYIWGFYNQGPTLANFSNLPYRRLNTSTFTYTPLDPGIDDPYGRGPFWPVLQVVFFLAQLLRDLQRVVEGQAWPHTDFSLKWEVLQKMMERLAPSDLNSADKVAAFIQTQISIIKNEYASLSPQDAYVHPDFVEANNDNTASPRLFDVPAVINIVREQIVTALKDIPIFMGMEHTGSSDGSTEFEIYVHSIERVRDIVAYHIARHCQLNCFMHGVQTNVVGIWRPIRTTQRLADAQSQNVEIQNAANKELLGFQSHDQSAMEITGTSAVAPADWDRYQPKRGPGQGEVGASTGSTPKGEDKNTSSNTVKGSTKSKNARALFSKIDEVA